MNSNLQAVFLDRDGVLNRYIRADYARKPSDLHLLPGAAAAVRMLNEFEIPVFVISNQQGVGKGLMTADDLVAVDQELKSQLKSVCDATVTQSYYCTHLKSDNCDCRKPKPEMILRAAREYNFYVAQSILIGDSLSDIETANNAGVGQSILLMSGATEIVNPWSLEPTRRPTSIARDLINAVTHILEDRKF